MDQVSAVVETVHYADQRLLTTRYLSECGCEWTVDMWGNVRRVKICPRDTDDIRDSNQLTFFPGKSEVRDGDFPLVDDPRIDLPKEHWSAQEILDREG